jgi:hypothetical protein
MIDAENQGAPCAKRDGLIVRELADETLVYDRDRDVAICLNAFAAEVWRHCDGKSSAADIAVSIGAESAQVVDERAVWLALDQLSRKHLLQQSIKLPAATLDGNSRRQMFRTIGIGSMVAVASVVVPTAGAHASCVGSGGACTGVMSMQCCSNLSCQQNGKSGTYSCK